MVASMDWLRLYRNCLLVLLLATNSAAVASSVWVLELDGAVGPASADYLIRGMAEAITEGATALAAALISRAI